MKITVKRLRWLISQLDYAGNADRDDPAAMLKWLRATHPKIDLGGDRGIVETKRFIIQDVDDHTIAVTWEPTDDEPADDIETDEVEMEDEDEDEMEDEDEEKGTVLVRRRRRARQAGRIKAAVRAEMARMGLGGGGGRTVADSPSSGSRVSGGASVAQLVYERKAAQGKTFFRGDGFALPSERSMLAQLWIAATAKSFKGDVSGAIEADRKYKSLRDRLKVKAPQNESNNEDGGVLVPPEFLPDVIDHLGQYGEMRRLARNLPMSRDTLGVPRQTEFQRATWIGEGQEIPESAMKFDLITLRAKKLGKIVPSTSELLQDAAVGATDLIWQDLSRGIALAEDEAFMLGDGTSTHGGITGILRKYGAANTNAGNNVLGGGTMMAHTTAHLATVVSRYDSTVYGEGVWLTSRQGRALIFDRLARSTGGVTMQEYAGFGIVSTWAGIPIITSRTFTPALPDANGDQIDAVYGSFEDAVLFGDRMQISLARDDSIGFRSDTISFRAIAREDINVYNTGTGDAGGERALIALWQS